jgi:hypothetical protein
LVSGVDRMVQRPNVKLGRLEKFPSEIDIAGYCVRHTRLESDDTTIEQAPL